MVFLVRFIKVDIRIINGLSRQFKRVLRLKEVFGTATSAGYGVTNGKIIFDWDIFEAYFAFRILDAFVYIFADFHHDHCPW